MFEVLSTYARQGDASWVLRTSGPAGRLTLAALAIDLSVDAVYEGIVPGENDATDP